MIDIVYDADAMLQGYPKPGHFRFAASQRQRGYVAENNSNGHGDTTPIAPIYGTARAGIIEEHT
jgi:hypothetical protein